jgi:hypothetical protein
MSEITDEAFDLISLDEAKIIASKLVGKPVTSSNISYLIQYGLIRQYGSNGNISLSKSEVENYYSSYLNTKEEKWKSSLGDDLNWALSFDKLAESERTKHVHRLHPYKGKFIPQLVEYFLDDHIDNFKKNVFFQKGDIIYDPFCGSGTTLVQANELGMHAIGVDISAFNSMMSNVKVDHHELAVLQKITRSITKNLNQYVADHGVTSFDNELAQEISDFNKLFFPVPQYRFEVRQGVINEKSYGQDKVEQFRIIFENLVEKHGISITQNSCKTNFNDTWFNKPVRDELDYVFDIIRAIDDTQLKKVLAIILSRTMRSCRATTHEDLATLVDPVFQPYYCRKHRKLCKPLFTISNWWDRYSIDTVKRLSTFDKLRTDTLQHCFTSDSRNIDIFSVVRGLNSAFSEILEKQKISGIFTSPPYVGLIDYHEQHAYAYDMLGFKRRDKEEIGPLSKGQTIEAQDQYVKGIAQVLINSRPFLKEDFNIFLVANDKYDLYPRIAGLASMQIVNRFKRPVLSRSEKNKTPYSETIFHIKSG